MIISVVLDMNDSGVHPAAGSEDEHRFIRYAVARFGAFSNITWDLGDDLDSYRDDKWAHETGTLLEEWDPYRHLATSHPVHTIHQDRSSSWFGFTSYQDWSRDQHRLMLESRKLQEKAGRIIPQTNEEYGYEDHYPVWALPGSDSSDVLRRTAWDIVMAGGYQTAGETARRGTNIWPDTGGGWMNGRGDDAMTMFLGYGHMVDFFTSFDWWKTNPHDKLVNKGNYCLAEPGKIYAVYLPKGGNVTIELQPGHYEAYWFSAMTGEKINLPAVSGGPWTSPDTPDRNDWALLLEAK
jgi:Putative collagen-binding domain of a collagenase